MRVGQLRIGQTRSFGPNGEPSAIDKRTVDRTLWLGRTGFADDPAKGDPRHHGGTEKLGGTSLPGRTLCGLAPRVAATVHTTLQPGGFGENLSTSGLTESTIIASATAGASVRHCWSPRNRANPVGNSTCASALPDMARRVAGERPHRLVLPGAAWGRSTRHPATPRAPAPGLAARTAAGTLGMLKGITKAWAEMARLM